MRAALILALPLLIAAAPFDPFGAATIVERPGAATPLTLPFRDRAGRWTTMRAIGAGRPILLVPVLHACPNFCGVTLDGMLAAVDAAAADPRAAAVIAFGIDPREGPAEATLNLDRLRQRHPGSADRVATLTGEEGAIRRVTDALGYRYAYDPRIGQYAHVAGAAVLTPDGRLVRWLYGIAPKPGDLRDALADARAGRTGGVLDRLILLCYHYDPSQGRYGFAIDRLLKLACAATALALAGYVLRARRREKRAC